MILGSDPELFLTNGNNIVSAIGVVGGTKKHPLPLKELGKGFFVQEDNVLLEFNTPPSKKVGDWVRNHQSAIEHLAEKMKTKGLSLKISASEELPDSELANPAAHIFGCDPDFNAWTLRPNPKPRSSNHNLRVAGGHVHVEFNGSKSDKILLVRRLDLYLGLWSVICDKDTRRRELYGKAGAFRFKPYGVEYRVLSNFWLQNPDRIQYVWSLVSAAISSKLEPDPTIVEVINSSNVEGAKEIFKATVGTYGVV